MESFIGMLYFWIVKEPVYPWFSTNVNIRITMEPSRDPSLKLLNWTQDQGKGMVHMARTLL